MERCDVCQMEFPSSQPQPAVADAPLGGGMWGYLCESHLGHARGPMTKLVQELAWQEFTTKLDRVLITPCDCGTCEDCS